MTTKYLNFMALSWFLSVLICLTLEGSQLGAAENRVINDLFVFTTLKIGGLFALPAASIYFFRGVFRLITFDYSFYTGGYQILRYLWIVLLSPGAVWGIITFFIYVYTEFLTPLRV